LGCLGPQTADTPAASTHILPAGSSVPALADDPTLLAQVLTGDGIGGTTAPLYSGFAAGEPVSFWELGAAPPFAGPMYVLVQRDGAGNLVPTGHPPILGTIPGDTGYSPFRLVVTVEVTAAYAGQVLPSTDALDDAVAAGLVGEPTMARTAETFLVAAPTSLLDLGDGSNFAANHPFYYDGVAGYAFDLGPIPGAAGAGIPAHDRAVLSREGEPPLSEPLRHVDMDGDGDTLDTNDLLALAHDDPSYTPSYVTVDVTVPDGTKSIDSSHDQTKADLTSLDQVFSGEPSARTPVTGTVIAYDVGTAATLCPRRADLVMP
jgi:hypothetical protein